MDFDFSYMGRSLTFLKSQKVRRRLLYLLPIFLVGSIAVLEVLRIPVFNTVKAYILLNVEQLSGSNKIDSLSVDHRFEDYKYNMLWLRDFESDIALGINQGDFKDSNFGTRIHDSNTGPKEYSCYPDDVVYAQKEDGQLEIAYAGYLKWKGEARIKTDGLKAVSAYTRSFGMGLLTKYIEPFIFEEMADINADIQVQHVLSKGKRFVKTEITITNTYPRPAHFYWVYQDGVYLYLPNQHQSDVIPFGRDFTGSFKVVDNSQGQWIGLVDFKHGIASVIYSPHATRLFALNYQLGINSINIKNPPDNFPTLTLGGNDRYILRKKKETPTKHLAGLRDHKLPPVSGKDFKNQGVLLDFGILESMQTKKLSFYRIGIGDVKSESEIRKIVQFTINHLYSEKAQ